MADHQPFYGDLVSFYHYDSSTLCVCVGEKFYMPIYTSLDGILASFNELVKHLKSNMNLNNLSRNGNIKHFNELNYNNSFTKHTVNVIEAFRKSKKYMDVFKHNLEKMNQLELGDRVDFDRGAYTHASVLIDRSKFKIIHVKGEDGANSSTTDLFNKAIVCEDYLIDVMLGDKIYKNNRLDRKYKPNTALDIVGIARARLGDKGYHLLKQNCQHFVNECRNNQSISDEVEKKAAIGIKIGGSVGGILIGVVAAIATIKL